MSLARFCFVWLLPALAGAQTVVDVVTVISRPVERTLRLPGEFAPYEKVDIYARVSGFVERVEVDRGSAVRRGQLLVVLSAPELTAQLAEAEAKAQSAESQRAGAEARLVAATSTSDRLRAASATPGAVAANELVQAEKAVDAVRAALRAQEASANAAKASVEAVRELEAYLKVHAPFDGVITERLVSPGALAGPAAGGSSGPLLRLEQNSKLRLIVAVPEASVAGIVPGARVPFTVPAWPGEVFSGSVARIAHSVDLKTRTMAVEVDVLNPRGRIAPGMFPEVRWLVERRRPSLLVPPSSVATTSERTFVIRVNGGRAAWVDVARGAPAGELVEVFGDLRAGDQVVRRATDEIRDESPATVRVQ